MSMIDTVKAHPYLFGGVAIVAVFFILLSNASTDDGEAVNPGDRSDLQAALAQAQTQMASIQAASAANSENVAAALEAKRLDAQTTTHANELAASVAMAQLNTAAQVQTHQDTLSAGVANNTIAAQTQQLQISTQGQVDMTHAYVDSMVQMTKIQAGVQRAAIEHTCSGFFSCLFK